MINKLRESIIERINVDKQLSEKNTRKDLQNFGHNTITGLNSDIYI